MKGSATLRDKYIQIQIQIQIIKYKYTCLALPFQR